MLLRVLAVAVAGLCLHACACTGTPPAVTPSCAEGEARCGSDCAVLKLDSRHCGACGQACPESYACADGTCYPRDCAGERCPEAAVCLAGACVDRACFGVVCDPTRACAKGACVERDCGTMPCPPGEVCSMNACVEASCFG